MKGLWRCRAVVVYTDPLLSESCIEELQPRPAVNIAGTQARFDQRQSGINVRQREVDIRIP
jgi:hypothetical protein